MSKLWIGKLTFPVFTKRTNAYIHYLSLRVHRVTHQTFLFRKSCFVTLLPFNSGTIITFCTKKCHTTLA
uniref:Uncharacterized protein n=1 Tax=Ciona intestinalis TaxID=7719 RepID=H2XR50_CIOIN